MVLHYKGSVTYGNKLGRTMNAWSHVVLMQTIEWDAVYTHGGLLGTNAATTTLKRNCKVAKYEKHVTHLCTNFLHDVCTSIECVQSPI